MRNQQLNQQVLNSLRWDAEKFSLFYYECAEKYMSGFVPAYPQVVTQIMKSPIFWNWWASHWEMRDEEFLKNRDGHTGDLVELYMEHHDPRTLLTAIYMSGQVLEESYATMIGEVTKSQYSKKEVSA